MYLIRNKNSKLVKGFFMVLNFTPLRELKNSGAYSAMMCPLMDNKSPVGHGGSGLQRRVCEIQERI
jgi:hypothetical protein